MFGVSFETVAWISLCKYIEIIYGVHMDSYPIQSMLGILCLQASRA